MLYPNVPAVFYSFRVMVGTGLAMLALSWVAVVLMARRRRGVEGLTKPVLYGFVAMTFSGWLATLAGWYTTEMGRQPWLVQGVLMTEAAVADVPAPMVLSTLLTYLAIYALLTATYVWVIFYLARRKTVQAEVPNKPRSPKAAVATLARSGMRP